jgi:hypothetical protein
MIVGGKREAEVLKVGFKFRMTTSRRLSGARIAFHTEITTRASERLG